MAKTIGNLSAKALASGAGRFPRFQAALAKLPADAAGEVLAALDEVSRPMTARELEKALTVTDLNFTHRRTVVAALKGFDVLLVTAK